MRFSFVGVFAFAWCFVGSTETASAQEVDGSVQIGLSVSAVAFERTEVDSSTGVITTQRLGLGSEFAPVGVDFGYAVHEFVVLGLRFGAGLAHSEADGGTGKQRVFRMRILPNVAILVPTEVRIRPFLRAGLGSAREALEVDGNEIRRQRGVHLGTGVGFHLFMTNSLSLSSELAIERARFKRSSTVDDLDSVLDVRLAVGISGWLGGGRDSEPRETPRASRR